MKTEFIRSEVFEEVLICKPSIYWDLRGNIFTSFNNDYQKTLGKDLHFNHDKFAISKKDVLRGLHGDHKTWKLVSCAYGEIYEVIVDWRPESKTFKKWQGFRLKADEFTQVLIPPGFVNGYCVLIDEALFHYKLAYDGRYLDADEQLTVKWDDPELEIDWPIKNPILQNRDK